MKKIIIKKKPAPYINTDAYHMFERKKRLKREQLLYAKWEKEHDRWIDNELNHTDDIDVEDLNFFGLMFVSLMSILMLCVIAFL